jgi:hypothetical protein
MDHDNQLEELSTFILDKYSNEKRYFSIEIYGGGHDESFIRANKSGLIAYAGKLLAAAKKIDEENKDNNPIKLDHDDAWIHGDIFIDYVEPIFDLKEFQENVERDEGVLSIVLGVGCLAIFFIIIISICVGIYTIFQWVF